MDALQVAQEGLRAMQALQQQTAEAHQRFLEGQALAHRTFQSMMESQQRLLERSLGLPDSSPSAIIAQPRKPAVPGGFPTSTVDALESIESRTTPAIPPAPRPEAPSVAARSTARAATAHAPAPRVHEPDVFSSEPTEPPTIAAPIMPTARLKFDDPPTVVTEVTDDDASARFSRVLLGVVAELTGYPIEMLELDMDMEADLGIDSIKRVEILAAVQERMPGMNAVNPEYMGSLRTVRQIVEYSTRPASTGDASAAAAAADVKKNDIVNHVPTPAPRTVSAPERCAMVLPEEFRQPTGLERRVLEVVELPSTTRGGLRIDSGRQVWITDDGTELASALAGRIRAQGFETRVIRLLHPTATEVDSRIGALIILDRPESPTASDIISHRSDETLKAAFALARAAARDLRTAGASGGALLATISRLDGAFGLSGRGDFDPAAGGLAGLAKTAAHEWPGVRCRALDVTRAAEDTAELAAEILAELETDGPVEVALDGGVRRGLQLVTRPVAIGEIGLCERDVVVVTGGARGVTAEGACALAAAVRPTLVLLGRSAAPATEPAWRAGLEHEGQIKRAILEHEFAAGATTQDRRSVSPADLEAAYRRHIAARQMRHNLARMESTGARVVYRQVDLRDAAAVRHVLDRVQAQHGPIRAAIHGAGVLEDRRIEDKSQVQFDAVFDTKVAGLRALLGAIDPAELRYLALFSSVSGRFGRQGQVDYAMANEVLNKAGQRFAALHRHCRVVSINWGPWDGGMVSPALKREFTRLGISLIPPEAGARAFVQELANAEPSAVEVVLGGTAVQVSPDLSPPPAKTPANHAGSFSVAFEREIDLKRHPFLVSHVIGGHPVLPMAMMVEWLAHGALHANPGLLFHGIDDLRVLKGVILKQDDYSVRVMARPVRRTAEGFEVEVELHGGPAGHAAAHARGRVLLVERLPAAPHFEPIDITGIYGRDVDSMYREIMFHGPAFQGIEEIVGCSSRGIVARIRAAAAPRDWMSDPLRTAWLADPLVLDCALQLGLIWSNEHLHAPSLPSHGARYRQYRAAFPRDGVTAALEVHKSTAHLLTADVTCRSANGAVVARAEGVEWVADASLKPAMRRGATAGAGS